MLLVMSGCREKPAPQGETATEGTARSELTVAQSALSTAAPDAKLLVVQTAEPVTATATPSWAYLFGSPSTDKTYIVYVSEGQVLGAQEYGTAGLPKGEWQSVPETGAWSVDSDAAYRKARETSDLEDPDAYEMGMLTYVPRSEAATATTKTLTWYVTLRSGTGTATVLVDAKTGAATRETSPAVAP